MCDYRASYKHISRDVFNRLSDRLKDDYGITPHITIYYNGTNLYGGFNHRRYGRIQQGI